MKNDEAFPSREDEPAKLEQQIELVVNLMRSKQTASEKELIMHMVSMGMSKTFARQMFLILPLAYAKVGLARCGVTFTDEFLCVDKGSHISRKGKFHELPIWNEAILFAEREVSLGLGIDALLSIAQRSSTVDATCKALKDGRKLEGFRIGPTVFGEDVFFPKAPRSETAKQWWQFWRK